MKPVEDLFAPMHEPSNQKKQKKADTGILSTKRSLEHSFEACAETAIPSRELSKGQKLICKEKWFRQDLSDGSTTQESPGYWNCSDTDSRVSWLKSLGPCPNTRGSGACVCRRLVLDSDAQWKARQMYCQICSDYGHKAGNRLLASMILAAGTNLVRNKNKSFKYKFEYKVVVPEHGPQRGYVRRYFVCRRQFQYLFGLTDSRLSELTKLSFVFRRQFHSLIFKRQIEIALEDKSYNWIGDMYYFEMRWNYRKGPYHDMWLSHPCTPGWNPFVKDNPPLDSHWPRIRDHFWVYDIALYAKISTSDASVAHLPPDRKSVV